MIYNERQDRRERALAAAKLMMTAARTAPKGKGMDIIEVAIADGNDIIRISEALGRMAVEMQLPFMTRDSANVLLADAILLIGTARHEHGLNCGHCGFDTCGEKPASALCALNTVDVGIATGSAASVAADLRVDTRVMFSAGLAAQRLGMLGEAMMAIAMPVSISSKNPFFDRA
ncbi:MAG: DUF2148 domain-containing protein [Tannerellaceae bacterium]|nr:DUF2148 domain-containing protein [Tannerellaceae bacterium]